MLADNWYGMIVPAATPPAILAKLNTATNEALKDKGVIDKLCAAGRPLLEGSTPEQLAGPHRVGDQALGRRDPPGRHQDE